MIEWLQASAYAAQIRESQFIYPLLQSVHICAIAMFAGSMMLVNLRLAGVGRSIPLLDFNRHVLPVAWLGVALFGLTGLNMAVGFIEVFAVNPVMQTKLVLVGFAIANAAFIQRNVSGGSSARWAIAPPSEGQARAWGAICISILLTLIILGKLLAYIGGKD